MLKQLILMILICCTVFCSEAQEITVKGGFLEEEIKIGEPVNYFLTATYPRQMEVLFPDSTFNFGIFEFEQKQYFPSSYDSAAVFDSAVYTLTSFEIDAWQKLSLPVFLVTGGDSTRIDAALDSLNYFEVAPEATDTTSLITDLNPATVPLQVNYPYIMIGVGIFLVVLIIVALVFGQKILNHFRIRRLKKGFGTFSNRYDELVAQVSKSAKREQVEEVIAYWKRYLEKLDKKPYTKLTTKEVIAVTGDERLKQNLNVIDRNIYGNGEQSDDLHVRFQSIKSLAQEYQERKIAELKNG
ncbi:MAG: hypothetical protein AAFO69_03245 [Bacteroidota bacterium]